ncbi:MAG: PAS domain S-box protein [Desulfobacteraceae bacterium]|nr:PAS domain S-box protein [Desulfobacteraceae bacterium]
MESRSLTEEIVTYMTEGLVLTDTQGTVTFINLRLSEMLEYLPEEVIGKCWLDMLHAEQQAIAKQAEARRAQGHTDRYEIMLHRKDGHKFPVLIGAGPRFDKQSGEFIGTMGVVTDITKRKLTDEALQESEEKYRILFEHTGEALFVAQDGRIVFQNPRSIELTGYSTEEFQSKPFVNFIHEDDREMVSDYHIRRLKGEKLPERYAFRIIHKNGSILTAELNAVLIQWNDKPAVLCFMTDITERRQAEAALKESEELSRKLLSTMPDLIVQTDLNGDIIFVNDYAFPNPKSIPMENFLGKNMLSFIAEKDQLRALENTKLMFDKSLGPREYQLLLVDGTVMDAEVNGDVIHDAENNPKGMVFVIRDITERKKMEKQLLQVEKGESLSRMAGAVAHHFNNILMITIGHLEMIQGDIPQGSETADSIKEAAQAAHRAVTLSQLMLTYLGQGVRKNENTDLSELCRVTMKDLSKTMPENISLTTRFAFTGLMIQSDRSHLEQVLNILFENAVEALAEKTSGKISVSLEPAETSDIQYVHMFPNNWQAGPEAHARLVFSDTGKGMAEETIPLIFDPFYSDKFTGRGMGLAVTLGIVKAHGGCICVNSKPGKGTDFIIFLPVSTMSENGSARNSS